MVNWTFRNKLQWIFYQNSNIFIQGHAFESVVCEMAAILSRGRWVKAIEAIEPQWHHMTSLFLVNTVSGNGLVPDSTKPLSKPMLTNCQLYPSRPWEQTLVQFELKYSNFHSRKLFFWKHHLQNGVVLFRPQCMKLAPVILPNGKPWILNSSH